MCYNFVIILLQSAVTILLTHPNGTKVQLPNTMDIISQSDILIRPASAAQANDFYKMMGEKSRASPSDFLLAAFRDDQAIAVVRALPYDQFVLIRSLFVTPEFRQCGVASKLMGAVLLDLKQSGLPQQVIAIATQVAIPLYQKLGFTILCADAIPQQLRASYRRVRQGDQVAPVMAIQI